MGIFQNLSEGGQTWAHRMRMLRQVFKIATLVSSSIGLFVLIVMMLDLPAMFYQSTWYYLKAYILKNFVTHIEINTSFWSKLAHEYQKQSSVSVPIQKILSLTYPQTQLLLKATLTNIGISSTITSITWCCLMGFFFVKGKVFKGKKHISGTKLSSSILLKFKLLLFNKASPIRLGSLPLIKGTETQHMIITGGTGSGKSNCINHLLIRIKKNKQKAIIVDTNGAFVKRFYRPNIDILLNPFDQRSVSWHPWIECRNNFDYEALAESFIPQSYHESENYWRQAGRTLLSSVLQKLENSKKTSELTNWLLFETLPRLCSFVEGTKAASHMDINSEKTSSSVRSVAASFLSCIEHLNDAEDVFSIRDWIQNEEQFNWLFINCAPGQRAAINPLLSSWISVAIRSLIQLETNLDRRLWFILDELPSLPKVKDLETFLAESRKYGGCGVLALQSISQLEGIYGKESTRTIVGNCSTKVVFSEQDPEIAERVSRMFGQREVKEFQEGISYGAHEVRDGVSLSSHNKFLPVVTSTDIQSLKKNAAFVRLPGQNPVTKVKFSII